jgi:nucleoid-associated protein YgaU
MASRYNRTAIVDNDIEFYRFLREKRGNVKNIRHQETPILKNPSIIERASLRTTNHIWKYGDRYYNLSHKYYKNPEYWWVIAWYNGYTTEADVYPGDYLQIPLDLEKALMVLGVY